MVGWFKYVKLLVLISYSEKLLSRGISLNYYVSLADTHLLFDLQGFLYTPLEIIKDLLNYMKKQFSLRFTMLRGDRILKFSIGISTNSFQF